MPKICIKRPPKKKFPGIEDFAALGAYIINYIRMLVPDDAYLMLHAWITTGENAGHAFHDHWCLSPSSTKLVPSQ